ncbi:MAG: DpnI domain-containing protein [Armatimonas sp.]
MTLQMNPALAAGYTSASQMARLITEDWGANNLYCCACQTDTLVSAPNNEPAYDYFCGSCKARYQLKSGKKWVKTKITDGALGKMTEAVECGNTPNLLYLHYHAAPGWTVANLLLVPSFFFTMSMIEARKPLGPDAKRAGWQGCNLRMDYVAPDGKRKLIDSDIVTPKAEIRAWYARVQPLKEIPITARGWTLDVLNIVQHLGTEFNLSDVYAHEATLSELHPDNRHVKDKIRQQLQVLRDLGFIEFLGRGRYLRR